MSREEKQDAHVNCLIDHLKSGKEKEIAKTAETLAVSSVMNEEQTTLPMAIQYTHGVANFAQALAKHDFKTAILFDSPEAFEFTSELLSDNNSASHLMLIEEPISLGDQAFPMSPDGEGWKIVILDDIVPFVGADKELTALLRAISSTMKDGANLIVRIAKLEDGKSWSREHNDTVVTEAIDKIGMRRFKRSFTSHGAVTLRHEDSVYSFDAADIHDCARNASFRPTRELGLDPSIWCCYEKI